MATDNTTYLETRTMASIRYEIRYSINGHEGSTFVLSTSDDAALKAFQDDWTECGDPLPDSFEIVARWSVSN